jgi:hypothetical protein
MKCRWFNMKLTIFLVYVFCVYLTLPCYGQKFQFTGKRVKETIKFIQVKNLIIIPVFINEKGPYNFLLDTGVGQMIITDTTFIKQLDLTNAKSLIVQGYGVGEGTEALLFRNITARVGHATIDKIPTAIFKTDVFNLSSYLGVKIHGILGYYFFNSLIVRINYSSNQLTYYDHRSRIVKKGNMMQMKIINAKPYITATLAMSGSKRQTIELLVDNGSSHALMMESLNEQSFPLPPLTIPANLGVGINGEIHGAMGRVDSLWIADFKFSQMLAGFPEYSTERNSQDGSQRNGTLGAEILKHFLVTFDYLNNALYLKKRSNYSKKSDHDMSGMEIYIDFDSEDDIKSRMDSFFIGRIEPASPAELAGILPGDKIISIDFRSMDNYTLNDLTELLKERDGKQLVLEIARKSERFYTILRLKRRI